MNLFGEGNPILLSHIDQGKLSSLGHADKSHPAGWTDFQRFGLIFYEVFVHILLCIPGASCKNVKCYCLI